MTIYVAGKEIQASGSTDLLVQNEVSPCVIDFDFVGTGHEALTSDLIYKLWYKNNDGEIDSEPLVRTELTSGFKLSWTPSAAATSCAGKFIINITAYTNVDTFVWKTKPCAIVVSRDIEGEPIAFEGNLAQELQSFDKAVAALNLHLADSEIHVTTEDKETWNAKYDKPSTGIPRTDLASGVQSSLDKADSVSEALPFYSLTSDTGYQLDLEIDSSTYVITPKMYNKGGKLIATGQSVDLPLESVVVSGSYDSVNKKIVLTLKNGGTVDIPVADLISGLATQEWVLNQGFLTTDDDEIDTTLPFNADTLQGYNAAHFNNAIAAETARAKEVEDTKVDKVSGSSLVPNSKFTDWDAKYNKPESGIPKADLASSVQTSLSKADTALQEHQSLALYSLSADTGFRLDLVMDQSTYEITPKMFSKAGALIATGASIDLPMESVVVDGSYDSVNKKIILTLKNGNTIEIPIGDLISDLATQKWVEDKGYYAKPSTGIPKTDLASDVQTSLGKADSAIQEHQTLKTINGTSLVGSGDLVFLTTSDDALS